MDMNVEMHGLDELDEVLKLLPEHIQKRSVNRITRKAAKLIADEQRANVNVDTGGVKEAIKIEKVRRRQGSFFIGAEQPYSRKLHLLEFGHAKAQAFPFIRSAFDNKSAEALSLVVNELHDAVMKEAAKLAGRK